MENDRYENARARSRGLFGNALIVPIALAVVEHVGLGEDLTIPQVRAWLGGRAAGNQIGDALGRIERSGALIHLPYLGRPHAHHWERREHAFWDFVEAWERSVATP